MPYAVAATAWDADPAPGGTGELLLCNDVTTRRSTPFRRSATSIVRRAQSRFRSGRVGNFPCKAAICSISCGSATGWVRPCWGCSEAARLSSGAPVRPCPRLARPRGEARRFRAGRPGRGQRQGVRAARVQPGRPSLARPGDARRGVASAPRRRLGALAAPRCAWAWRVGPVWVGRARTSSTGSTGACRDCACTSWPSGSAARRSAPRRPRRPRSRTSRVRTGGIELRAALGAGLRDGEGGAGASHRLAQRLHAGRGAADRARDLPLPPQLERLERHRLQRPRRQVRHALRGPRRRARPGGDRRARAGVQLADGGDRQHRRLHVASARARRRSPPRPRYIRWKLGVHGQPLSGPVTLTSAGGSASRYPAGTRVTLERVSGHRDTGKTACPGDALYDQLDEHPRARRVGHAVRPTFSARVTAALADHRVDYGELVPVTRSARGPRRQPARGAGGGGPGEQRRLLEHRPPSHHGRRRQLPHRPQAGASACTCGCATRAARTFAAPPRRGCC